MEFIPAIDILGGSCVRLYKGDYNRVSRYSMNPAEMALRFSKAGARRIHMVDLDGARTGHPVNHDQIIDISRKNPGLIIEIGGGIRNFDHVSMYAEAGLGKLILGSRGVNDRDFLAHCIERYQDRIVLGMDCRDGRIAVHGWKDTTAVSALDFLAQLDRDRIYPEIIFTDIARDGTLSGPPVDLARRLCRTFRRFSFILSGGISSMRDVERVLSISMPNLIGMISGKAIYEDRINVREAVERCGRK